MRAIKSLRGKKGGKQQPLNPFWRLFPANNESKKEKKPGLPDESSANQRSLLTEAVKKEAFFLPQITLEPEGKNLRAFKNGGFVLWAGMFPFAAAVAPSGLMGFSGFGLLPGCFKAVFALQKVKGGTAKRCFCRKLVEGPGFRLWCCTKSPGRSALMEGSPARGGSWRRWATKRGEKTRGDEAIPSWITMANSKKPQGWCTYSFRLIWRMPHVRP